MQNFFTDSLLAGRLVSVFTGFLTMSGIYYFCQKNLNKKTAILASILYIFIPIFSFYDRQALMESSIAACGVWGLIFLSNFLNEKKIRLAICLGVVLGMGFFIKSSSLLFLISSILIITIYLIKEKNKGVIMQGLFATSFSFLCVVFLLIINPQFWQTLSKNYVFTLSANELLGFPFLKWMSNLFGNLEISFFYLTPVIFFAFVLGILKIIIDKNKKLLVLLFFILFSFLTETLVTRLISDRYLVSVLPLFCIPVAYVVNTAFLKNKIFQALVVLVLLLPALFFTSIQIISPVVYIKGMSQFTKYYPSTYIDGFTSGYGINETVSFIKNRQKLKPFIVTVAENTGNPESAMLVYFNYMKYKNVKSTYLDARIAGNALDNYDCLTSKDPFYFVSREEQLAGMDRFLQKIKTIKNPYGSNTIGIYTLKTNCRGKTFNLVLNKQ